MSNTSIAAPAICLFFNTVLNACSSTIGPRDALINLALIRGFYRAICIASWSFGNLASPHQGWVSRVFARQQLGTGASSRCIQNVGRRLLRFRTRIGSAFRPERQ